MALCSHMLDRGVCCTMLQCMPHIQNACICILMYLEYWERKRRLLHLLAGNTAPPAWEGVNEKAPDTKLHQVGSLCGYTVSSWARHSLVPCLLASVPI